MKSGGLAQAKAILWWLQQSFEARAEIVEGGNSVQSALWELSHFIGEHSRPEYVNVWASQPTLDLVVLREAFKREDIALPWKYWNERCLRTALDILLFTDNIDRKGVHHHALDDATNQAKELIEAFKLQNKKGE